MSDSTVSHFANDTLYVLCTKFIYFMNMISIQGMYNITGLKNKKTVLKEIKWHIKALTISVCRAERVNLICCYVYL